MEEWVNQNKSAIIIGVSIIAAAVILAPKQQRYEAISSPKVGIYVLDKSTGATWHCMQFQGNMKCTK